MAKFTTLQQMVDYIHNYITEYESANDNAAEIVEKNVLYEMMEEELLDTVEEVLSEDDMKNWVEAKDDTYLDSILNERLEDYPGLLEDIKNEVLSEYVKGE
jgi:Glu-tRNA(Gln) amidotransferase subunit E-like FAD-binding protein